MMKLLAKLINTTKRRKLFSVTVLFCSFLVSYRFLVEDPPDLYFIHWGPLDNISCHYVDQGDALPAADGHRFIPPPRSIFFHETSCKGDLDSRQACAVESAARANPKWQVNVLFSAPVSKHTLQNSKLHYLQLYRNVKFARVHVLKYAKGTPLESLVTGGALNRTRWRISHSSDVLRFLTLYKWGGVYLDLDVVVVKPLSSLARNWAARESDSAIAAGALSFSRDQVGRGIADATVRDIKKKYRGDDWGNNGPGVITRVLEGRCFTTDARVMSAATCNGFEVYGPQFFYPIEWWRGRIYFEPGELEIQNAYIFHVWNQVTHDLNVHKDSPYAKLAKRFCPKIYTVYNGDFGGV